MLIRTAKPDDLWELIKIERICFPPEEAATDRDFKERLERYPNHFWILEDNGKQMGFVDGLVTNEDKIRDEMYKDASLHQEDGAWQTILGVNTLPEYRNRGYAAKMLEQVLNDAKHQGRKGCILTCKKQLIHYYEKFGFINGGISQSSHAGVTWFDMRLVFPCGL